MNAFIYPQSLKTFVLKMYVLDLQNIDAISVFSSKLQWKTLFASSLLCCSILLIPRLHDRANIEQA